MSGPEYDKFSSIPSIISLSLFFCGVGNVILGKIVEDPWGGYFLQKWVGEVSAAFAAGMPILEGLLMFAYYY